MIKRLLVLTTLGVLLSGCFMVPMAFVGPAVSGFSTASIVQSGVTTTASYMVKKSTGKTITEHAFDRMGTDIIKHPDSIMHSVVNTNNLLIIESPSEL